MATPSFINATTGSVTSTTITITAPASIASGDFLLAVVAVQAGATWTTPTGWTLTFPVPLTSYNRIAIFWKIAGGSEPSSYSFTASSSATIRGLIVHYSAPAATPIDASIQAAEGSGTTWTSSSFTNSVADDLLMVIVWDYSGGWAQPATGLTTRANVGSATGPNYTPNISVFDADLTTAGTIPSYTGAMGSTSPGLMAWAIAIAPSSGGTSVTGATLATASAEGSLLEAVSGSLGAQSASQALLDLSLSGRT